MKLKRKVNFDVCTFCNHACTFCSNPDNRTIKDKVSLEQFNTVMKNITRYIEIKELGLSAKGEVLINTDLKEIILSAKKNFGIEYTYISSNGAMATKKKMNELIESGLDSTKFSINAVTKEEYLEVHKKDDFDVVIENMKALLSLKRDHYPEHKITISSVIKLDDEELKLAFTELFGEELYSLIDAVYVYPLGFTAKTNIEDTNQIITKKCAIPFTDIYINSNCTLGFCCKDYFDEISFGSLLNNDFMTLYESLYYEELRKMHKTGVFPDNHLCKKCLLYGESQ